VSVILDALRRNKSAARENTSSGGRTARTDAVLATLGYRRPQPRDRRLGQMFVYGMAAVLVGFVGLSALIFVLTPSTPAPVPAQKTAQATRPTTTLPSRSNVPPAPAVAPRLSTPAAASSGSG
jgi:hypothetical protein